jgi:hypothetical protein
MTCIGSAGFRARTHFGRADLSTRARTAPIGSFLAVPGVTAGGRPRRRLA